MSDRNVLFKNRPLVVTYRAAAADALYEKTNARNGQRTNRTTMTTVRRRAKRWRRWPVRNAGAAVLRPPSVRQRSAIVEIGRRRNTALDSYTPTTTVTANNNRIYRHRLSGTPYVSSASVPSVFFVLFFYLFVRTARVTHVRHSGGDGSTYREPCNSICEQRCCPAVFQC